jgi:predicted  nucleic acid-binding Zn-ribbon protein
LSALNEKTIALANTEQALSRATKNTAELDEALTARKRELDQARNAESELAAKITEQNAEIESLRTHSQAAEQKAASLEEALAASKARIAELTSLLEAAQSNDNDIQRELKRTHEEVHSLASDLGARNSRIAALEAQLGAHADALSAIRRDIARVSTKRTAGETVDRKLVSTDRKVPNIVVTNGTLSIGRTADNDIQIPSNMVSRRHAQLLAGPNAVILEDLDSTNGCYVNGRQIKKHLLQDGDIVLIGEARYRYMTSQPTDARETPGA